MKMDGRSDKPVNCKDNYATKIVITTLVVIGLAMISGLGVWSFLVQWKKAPTFRTVPVKRGDLIATISATVRSSRRIVDVGAQVAGLILTFGKTSMGSH